MQNYERLQLPYHHHVIKKLILITKEDTEKILTLFAEHFDFDLKKN